jgi:hypothetical protein
LDEQVEILEVNNEHLEDNSALQCAQAEEHEIPSGAEHENDSGAVEPAPPVGSISDRASMSKLPPMSAL